MKLAIMQPYIFPYIGYFQLCMAADKFVFLDDVNFINKGWINRNNILLNNKSHLFTIPLKDASQNKKINTIEVLFDKKWAIGFFKTIEQAYKKAPYFQPVSKLITEVLEAPHPNIGELAKFSTIKTCEYIGLKRQFIESSSSYKNDELKGQARIIDICKQEQATEYINPIGGVELYESEVFYTHKLKLHFINTLPFEYKQFTENFVPWLSIIDVLMFNTPAEVIRLLNNYELVDR